MSTPQKKVRERKREREWDCMQESHCDDKSCQTSLPKPDTVLQSGHNFPTLAYVSYLPPDRVGRLIVRCYMQLLPGPVPKQIYVYIKYRIQSYCLYSTRNFLLEYWNEGISVYDLYLLFYLNFKGVLTQWILRDHISWVRNRPSSRKNWGKVITGVRVLWPSTLPISGH